MGSDFSKAAIGFGILMAAGFLIVGTTRETPQEKQQGAFIQTSSMLGSLALRKCSEAVKEAVGSEPYTPVQNDSDHVSHVTMVWENVGSVKRAECRYVMDQGITLLQLDDRKLIEKQPVGSAPEAPKSVHHQ